MGYDILNEEIFRREETKLIDNEFAKILSWFSKPENKDKIKFNKVDLDVQFSKELDNITKLIKKLMNATIILKFDDQSSLKRLSFGMCIYPSTAEMHGKIRDAIEKHKDGFYLSECKNCLVFIDYCMLSVVEKYKIGPRGLTAVLLHELGHKIYVKSQYDINKDGQLKYVITCYGFMFSIVATLITVIIPIILLIIMNSSLNRISTETYSNSEHLSDSIAVKYGYAEEIYKTMDIFYEMTKTKHKGIFSFLNKWSNALNASKIRRDLVEELVKKELNDPNNTEKEKALLKKSLEEMKKNRAMNESYKFSSEKERLYVESLLFENLNTRNYNEWIKENKDV